MAPVSWSSAGSVPSWRYRNGAATGIGWPWRIRNVEPLGAPCIHRAAARAAVSPGPTVWARGPVVRPVPNSPSLSTDAFLALGSEQVVRADDVEVLAHPPAVHPA